MTTRRLGRYELLEQLGEGGMGAVWLARLSGTGGFEKLCIVKTVLPAIAKDAGFVSRFLHEGRVLTQLQHGNIAQVLDMDEVGGELFLALEYVAGVDLARLHQQVQAEGGVVPVPLAVMVVQQAAEGLAAAHRKAAPDGAPLRIVHRDVSPQNLMVSYEGEVKVIDFGIARSEARSHHTAQATVMGKLGYMAPEQARGLPVDHRADQYSLAVVLWELLANQPFVPRGTLTEMVVAMASPVPRPLAPLRPEVPAALEAVVSRALAPEPDGRFPTTDDFAHALTAALLSLGPPPTRLQLGEWVRGQCAQAWQAQQELLTRVTTRRPAAPMPLTEVAPSDELASTLVRTGSTGETAAHRPAAPAVVAPAATPSVPPQTTGELAAAVRPGPSKAALGGLGVAVVAALALGGWLLTRDPGPAPMPPRAGRPGVGLTVDAGAPMPGPGPVAAEGPPSPPVPDAGEVLAAVPPSTEPEVPAVEPAVERAPEEAPPVPELSGVVRFAGPPTNAWVVTNKNRTTWTGCQVTAPGQRVASVARIEAGASTDVPVGRFRSEPGAPALTRELRVTCDQGAATFTVR